MLEELDTWAQWLVVFGVLLLPSIGLYYATIRPGRLERERLAERDAVDRFTVQRELIGDRLGRLGEAISRNQEGLSIQAALLEASALTDEDRRTAREGIARHQVALEDLESGERALRAEYDDLALPQQRSTVTADDESAALNRTSAVARNTEAALKSAASLNDDRIAALEKQIQRVADSVPGVHVGPDKPTDPRKGDMWIVTDDDPSGKPERPGALG